jgi:glutamine synthetase
MTDARKQANSTTDVRKQAIAYCDKVKAHFETIRYHVDKLELIVDDENWTLPKYREMLFTK